MTGTENSSTGETAVYDSLTNAYRFEYDPTGTTSPAVEVVMALADVTDVDPIELDALDSYLDPDALNALLAPRTRGDPDRSVSVSFTVDGHRVRVDSEGTVVVSEPPEC